MKLTLNTLFLLLGVFLTTVLSAALPIDSQPQNNITTSLSNSTAAAASPNLNIPPHPLGTSSHDRGPLSETSLAPPPAWDPSFRSDYESFSSLSHTNSNTNTSSLDVNDDANRAQACWFDSQYGCSKGYCWVSCFGQRGSWCWAMEKKQSHPPAHYWAKCSWWGDCNAQLPCGGKCSC